MTPSGAIPILCELDSSDYSYQLITTLSYVRPNDPMMITITPARQLSTGIFLCDELAGRTRTRAGMQKRSCLEIGHGSRRLNKFGNKRRANMKSYLPGQYLPSRM
jgi:hypothetical protein